MKDEENSLLRTGGGPSPSSTAALMHKEVVRGLQRLSTISEQEGENASAPQDLPGDSEQTASTCFSSVSSDTFQPSMGDDCAAILLACLFCHLSEFLQILPETFNRALDRWFPSCKYLCALSEPTYDIDCCTCTLDLDCGLLGSCREASEFLELGLEISEVCHR